MIAWKVSGSSVLFLLCACAPGLADGYAARPSPSPFGEDSESEEEATLFPDGSMLAAAESGYLVEVSESSVASVFVREIGSG